MENFESNTIIGNIDGLMRRLKIDFGSDELSAWAVSCNADGKELEDLRDLLERIYTKGYMKRRSMISDLSGIPQEDRKTFDNYDFSCTTQQNKDAVMAVRTLSFLNNGYNVVITGNTGTGKTHIAQAIGNECIDHLVRTSFMTLSSLKARIARASRNGKVGSLVSTLSSIPCLIINEIDKCTLEMDECAVLFDIVNRKYSSRGLGSIVMTSNSQPSAWTGVFKDGNLAECILDRLFDRSYCFDFKGPSFRGKHKVATQENFASTPILPMVK